MTSDKFSQTETLSLCGGMKPLQCITKKTPTGKPETKKVHGN